MRNKSLIHIKVPDVIPHYPFLPLGAERTLAHFCEAIPACAAIVIRHFYFVMFDSEEYPVK